MKVLIIEDEASLAKLLELGLKTPSVQVEIASSAKTAREKFPTALWDFVVSDISLPDGNGLDLLREFRGSASIIMMTAHGSVETALEAMKHGAYDYLQKPFEVEELKIILERGARERSIAAELQRLKHQVAGEYDFSHIIGSSPKMKSVFEKLKKVSDTNATVLILGESGTGKELLAKAIHLNSERRAKSFVVVDCGAIPANLIESELFGHVKGAFTGADRPKTGLFEEADGGTIFLDEIGELPIEMQSKLLRVLQESTIKKVGDTKTISINVRIIAATNRDLEAEVRAGRFRQDLFYRINVVPVEAPALRERREDIPLLAHFFLKRYAKEYKRPASEISPLVVHKLQAYEWPGNVRQLENVVEQMVVMSDASSLTEKNLPPPLNGSSPVAPPELSEETWDLKRALEEVQRYTESGLIQKALLKTNGNKTKAAQMLGISRRALIYKAQEYGLTKGDMNDETEEEA